MNSLIISLFLYFFSFGLQASTILIAYRILNRYQHIRLSKIFLFLTSSTLFIQYTYLLTKDLNQSFTSFSNALFVLINSLMIWTIVSLLNFFLTRSSKKMLFLSREIKIDTLTRVFNRNTILFYCEYELAKSQRSQQPVSILFIDMDRFKYINDSYGHPIGDEILIKSTRQCRLALREIDLIGRIGGDEFIVLLPNTDYNAAQDVAVRIQTEMQSLNERISINISTPITLSIGIASYSPRKQSIHENLIDPKLLLDELINISDRSMYLEKRVNHMAYTLQPSPESHVRRG